MPTPYDPHYDIRSPSRAELREISDRYGLSLEDDELAIFAEQIELSLSSYRRLRELPEPRPPVRYPRTPGTKATADANELNAWYWHCDITGSEHGLLRGRGVVVKDNVCLAGVPMSNGSAILEGYVPEVDATVVTRVLDAGGRIVGRAVGENFGVTSGSNTAATGSVLHPRNPAYSVGGSSSGCAALVAAGEAELAIGGDQGGSIRIPAALCGVVGLKPTYGLVPYTGIFPIEHSLDHVGPMATSVEDVAALLEVMAGADGFDPRQPTGLETQPYRECVGTDVSKLTIGVLTEAFDWPDGSDPRCDELIRDFAARIADIGARVEEISIPAHREAGHVAAPIYAEGIYGQLVLGRGLGRGWKGYYPTSLATVTGRGLRCGAQDLSATAKFFVLTGTYMTERYDGRYYGLAQNVARWLRYCYDEALERVDVLVMPTCAPEPKALPHIEKPGIAEVFQAGLRYHFNAGPFNITGHPAITIPAAEVDDLPVGMMIVGRAFGEATVLGVASAFENLR